MAKNPVGFEITNSTQGWNGADFDDVFIRKDCFLEGGLWVWGNNSGFLGDNTIIARSSPVQTVSGGTNWKSVSYNGAIKTDGTLWTWGQQTADNTIIARSSPVQTISGGTNWKQVSASSAIKTDGTLWTWGFPYGGLLGDNSIIGKSSPVQTISGGTNWKQVNSTSASTSAIKTDGTLWLWGRGENGRLGNNSVINRSSPVQTVSSGTNWKQVSTGNGSVGAIKTDGTLWLWGCAYQGQLGNNSIINTSSPVQTISGGTNWKQVSTGKSLSGVTAAIKTDGTLWTWGSGIALGNNSVESVSSPIQTVSGGTNWKQVDIGSGTMGAIKTDGSLWLWGSNEAGVLGIGIQTRNAYYSTNNVSSPVQTISGGTNWRTITIGSNALAIRDDCW